MSRAGGVHLCRHRRGMRGFPVLFSDMIQRGAVQFYRQLGHRPSKVASRGPARARPKDQAIGFDCFADEVVVLRILIEEFGGEVAASTLCRRLVRPTQSPDRSPELWLREILAALEHLAALTLEAVDGNDVIVRIESAGVSLAYDLPADVRHRQGATA